MSNRQSTKLGSSIEPIPNWDRTYEVSSGVVFRGEIDHENGRANHYIECIPTRVTDPGTAYVIGGGYTSSADHYHLTQRQLARHGHRSVVVGHNHYPDYEIGENSVDIYATCFMLGRVGVSELVLVGHSRGGLDVLKAHEMLYMEDDPRVKKIELVFSAGFIKQIDPQMVGRSALVLGEATLGLMRHPIRQMRQGARLAGEVLGDARRTIIEGIHLATNSSASEYLDNIGDMKDRPGVHIFAGKFDGLVPANLLRRGVADHHHDSFTFISSGHFGPNLHTNPNEAIVQSIEAQRDLRIAA